MSCLDCSRPVHARGLCATHYTKHRRAGTLPPRQTHTLEDRFWEKVNTSGDCWLWTGSTGGTDGRGFVHVNSEVGMMSAHRVSWIMANGPVPEGLWVLHHCDVPNCVRPSHLYAGTPKQNSIDLHTRGTPNHPLGERNAAAKMTAGQVRKIRADSRSNVAISRDYGISNVQVGNIKHRRSWKWLD